MEKAVEAFITKHQLIKPGTKVLVGVSGGPDSVALLHFLVQKRISWNLQLAVLSLDHQLRGEASRKDIAFVESLCRKWDIDFHGAEANVPEYEKKHQLSTEVAARELRYQFFGRMMQELEADYLALGHHGDDQIETMIMQLVRSASSTALSGIPVQRPFAGGKIIRPLLAVTKAEIENYCALKRLDFRIDITNFEEEHTRNYYRSSILPLLKVKNSNIHTTIQHLSETLQSDEKFLQQEAKRVLDETVQLESEIKKAKIEINLFKNHDESLQRRAFHLILNYLYETLPSQLSYVHQEAFFSLLSHKEGNVKIDFPDGLKLKKVYHQLYFQFENEALSPKGFHVMFPVPGTAELPDGSVLSAEVRTDQPEEDPFTFSIAAKKIVLPLHVRSRRPGDRMTWRGLNGTKKLKSIFIDAKIPLHKRETWPILVDGEGNILWLIGLRKSMQDGTDKENFIHITYVKGDLQEE